MLKSGATRVLDELERKRLQRTWVQEELTQAEIAKLFRLSVERVQLECKGLTRLCAPRASPLRRQA